MRTIKFRGKSAANIWRYGSLFRDKDNESWISFYNGTYCNNNTVWVEGASVGQFTGLHDKNGVEVYEGDIVEFRTWSKETAREQVRINEYACLLPFFDPFYVDDEQGEGIIAETIEVIGNIFDNPELLKQ